MHHEIHRVGWGRVGETLDVIFPPLGLRNSISESKSDPVSMPLSDNLSGVSMSCSAITLVSVILLSPMFSGFSKAGMPGEPSLSTG